MKKLMTLMAAAALTFGAATMYASAAPQKGTAKTKSTKPVKKSTKK
jgi:hypothetical protein